MPKAFQRALDYMLFFLLQLDPQGSVSLVWLYISCFSFGPQTWIVRGNDVEICIQTEDNQSQLVCVLSVRCILRYLNTFHVRCVMCIGIGAHRIKRT